MKNYALFLGTMTLAVVGSPANAATPFDFEGVPGGFYPAALTVNDGPLTLTVTPEGFPAGFLFVSDTSIPLLGKAVIGQRTSGLSIGQFVPLRFFFSEALDSITFNFGDRGGDSDSPVVISAYNLSGTLLGSAVSSYPVGKNDGTSLTLNFLGARYYIASSGSDVSNENSIFYDIASYTVANTAVPETATWAMMIAGFGLVGGALRRRTVRFAHA